VKVRRIISNIAAADNAAAKCFWGLDALGSRQPRTSTCNRFETIGVGGFSLDR
jgi:hypothetical protein